MFVNEKVILGFRYLGQGIILWRNDDKEECFDIKTPIDFVRQYRPMELFIVSYNQVLIFKIKTQKVKKILEF